MPMPILLRSPTVSTTLLPNLAAKCSCSPSLPFQQLTCSLTTSLLTLASTALEFLTSTSMALISHRPHSIRTTKESFKSPLPQTTSSKHLWSATPPLTLTSPSWTSPEQLDREQTSSFSTHSLINTQLKQLQMFMVLIKFQWRFQSILAITASLLKQAGPSPIRSPWTTLVTMELSRSSSDNHLAWPLTPLTLRNSSELAWLLASKPTPLTDQKSRFAFQHSLDSPPLTFLSFRSSVDHAPPELHLLTWLTDQDHTT